MNQEQLFPESESKAPPAASPCVSVLVRTMGRESLAAAVDSVRQQVFHDWEIVVLNAAGQAIAGIEAMLAGTRHQLLQPGERVQRAAAANMLLDAARGRYLLFLDDDDWLLPGHLAKLVSALEGDASLAAAYGDVVVLAEAGQPAEHVVHTFASDFDPVALQLQNHLPIHAVLFRAEAARAAPPSRFDTRMSLFEDWDFWLQLARKGPFRRVPGVSAVYAYEPAQGSAHAAQGSQRESMLLGMARRQLERWQPEDVVRLIERDARRSNEINDAAQGLQAARHDVAALNASVEASQAWARSLQEEVAKHLRTIDEQAGGIRTLEGAVRDLQAALSERDARIAQLENLIGRQQAELDLLAHVREQLLAQLAELHASRSWRITAPLRHAGRLARAVRAKLRIGLAAAATARRELARHGPAGFIRRLPYYLRHRQAYVQRIASAPPARTNPFDSTPAAVGAQRLHPDLDGDIALIDTSVSVVIPTYNAGPEFVWLMRKLRGQKAVGHIEIVIVDSGSRDATVAIAREAGAKVIEIPNTEFTHSHARNLGAQNATGEYLLFMVQDAYPIGEHWMYGMLRALRDPAHPKLAAVSCSEFGRSDSDLMYDSMIDTHYRFLGCLEADRVGRLAGTDHMSLRSQGQLSDVSCLIPRALFREFPYRGDYAEDLDLGIRLIKSGREVAMLASVKVIHSHNRAAYYYLKRSFVDVEFLVGMFDDFLYPHCESLPGLVAGIESAARHTAAWLRQASQTDTQAATGAWVKQLAMQWRRDLDRPAPAGEVALGDAKLEAFVRDITARVGGARPADSTAAGEARRFADSYAARLDHFVRYLSQVYDDADPVPQGELAAAVCKTFAAAAGSALAFYCLDHRKDGAADRDQADAIHRELTAGV